MRIVSFLLSILLSITFKLMPKISYADLNKQQRNELFERVEQICKGAKRFGEIITYEGSLDAGAKLKIVGVDGSGTIYKTQWDGLAQLFGDNRTDPTVCQFEDIKIIYPLFNTDTSKII